MAKAEMKPLWKTACRTYMERELSCDDPQTDELWFCGRGCNISTPVLKASLWGPADRITVSLSKPDVWDRRVIREAPVTLEEVKKGAFHPAFAEEGDTTWAAYGGHMGSDGVRRDGYPSWSAYDSPTPKPVGQIVILAPDFAGCPAPKVSISASSGLIRICQQNAGARLEIKILPCMARNLICIEGLCSGLQEGVSLRLCRHNDTRGKNGNIGLPGFDYAAYPHMLEEIRPAEPFVRGKCCGIEQKFPAEKTFPQGFGYTFAMNTGDAAVTMHENEYDLETKARTIRGKGNADYLEPMFMPDYDAINAAAGSGVTVPCGGRFLHYITVQTSNDGADTRQCAERVLQETEKKSFAWYECENAEWYRKFYEKRENGRIYADGADFDREYVKYLFHNWSDSNTRSCRPDPVRMEADSVYTPFQADVGLWHSLNCYNDLYDSPWQIVLHHEDRLYYWVNLVKHWLNAARQNVREVFKMTGATISHGYLPPIEADCYHHVHSAFEFCMEIGAQVCKVLWDIWDYTREEEFLKHDVYPYLRELAIFYAQYVTRSEDGYHVIPTVSAEQWGLRYRFGKNKDTSSACAFIRWTMRKAAEAARYLGEDLDKIGEWEDVEKNLPKYSVYETEKGKVLTDVAGVNPLGIPYNHFAGWIPVLLTDDVNLDSSEAEKELFMRTFANVSGWHRGEIPYLLGYNKDTVYAENAWFHRMQPQESIEAIVGRKDHAALVRLIENEPERLLNSRSGVVHVFPSFETNGTFGFEKFRARGGLLVSAKMRRRKVTFLCVEGTADTVCRLKSPWTGEVLCFDVKAGEAYEITKEGAILRRREHDE